MKLYDFAAKALAVSVFALAIGLSACSSEDDRRLNDDLQPPIRAELIPPPAAPDINEMHPALQLAKTRGLKTNVYFNEELQQNIARLQGMEETLGRLQNDLQGTALAMQRVEMMRQEIESMNIRMQSLQERLMYAGPVIPAGAPEPVMISEPMAAMHAAPSEPSGPTPLISEEIEKTTTAAQMKPVVDEKKSEAAPEKSAVKGSGVLGVRTGVHDGSVRVVLDIAGDTKYDTSVDTTEKLLTVELPNTPWKGPKSETLKNNPLIASYTAQDSGKGSIVVFTLKGDTKISNQSVLKGSPARLVIDLTK